MNKSGNLKSDFGKEDLLIRESIRLAIPDTLVQTCPNHNFSLGRLNRFIFEHVEQAI